MAAIGPRARPRARSAWSVVSIAVALLAVAAPTSSQRRPRPQVCPDQRYLIAGPLFDQADVAIVVEGRNVSIEPVCSPIRGRVKATRHGTLVIARWKTCGTERRVRLRGRIDTACEQLTGTITARRRGRVRFVASQAPAVTTTLPGTATTLPGTPTTTVLTSTTIITTTTVVATTTTNTTSTTLAGNVACDEASLRQAVAAGGTIVLDCGATTIPIAGVPMVIPAGVAVSITARGAGAVVLDGSPGTTRLFTVGGTLELDNLTIENFSTDGELGDDGIAGSDGANGANGEIGGPGEPGGPGDPGGAGGVAAAPVAAGAGGPARGGAILIDAGGLVRSPAWCSG